MDGWSATTNVNPNNGKTMFRRNEALKTILKEANAQRSGIVFEGQDHLLEMYIGGPEGRIFYILEYAAHNKHGISGFEILIPAGGNSNQIVDTANDLADYLEVELV